MSTDRAALAIAPGSGAVVDAVAGLVVLLVAGTVVVGGTLAVVVEPTVVVGLAMVVVVDVEVDVEDVVLDSGAVPSPAQAVRTRTNEASAPRLRLISYSGEE